MHNDVKKISFLQTGFTRKIHVMEGETHKMKTLSIHPPIFGKEEWLLPQFI